jgi:hypothetical protein
METETLEDHSNFFIDYDEFAPEDRYISNYDTYDRKSITWNTYKKHSFAITYFRAYS